MDLTVRPAREDDYETVAAFTRDTWADRQTTDYLPDIYHEWIADDGDRQRTLVLEVDDDVAGIVQASLLSEYEAWISGLRIDPRHRGRGLGSRLTDAAFDWTRERGAAVARNMVFSWNAPSLGLSRRVGFEPVTEVRLAHPTPDAGATAARERHRATADADVDPNAGWTFWTGSDARTRLGGLALAPDESWALAELTRERLLTAAAEGRLITVRDGGVCALSVRSRVVERAGDDGSERRAEYAVGAWTDAAAAEALFAAIARDAAAAGADRARVVIPESARFVTDAAAARSRPADEPLFVLAADLTDPGTGDGADRAGSDEESKSP